ncbi:MAG: TIGR03960 family B12-binding radical SAM protein [Cyanobacteriota bacterium]
MAAAPAGRMPWLGAALAACGAGTDPAARGGGPAYDREAPPAGVVPPLPVTAAPARSDAPIDFEALIDLSISKPGRYLGNERGVVPRDWQAASVRWALTYPEVYEVGASNLGHIILYSILNACPGQLCDRAYLPAPDLAQRLKERQQALFAVESRRPLPAFDILGFSLSYELSATNILEMLSLAQVPLKAADRGNAPLGDPTAPPLIFAGGPTATSNPEPYAAFFDFIALGDGEELLPEIGLVVAEAKAAGLSRQALLRDLAQVPGVYVPSLYRPAADGVTVEPLPPPSEDPSALTAPRRVLRRTARPMPHYAMGLVPHIETVHDRLTVEIRRGCTRGCRFCQPGMLTRPARDVEPEAVIEAVEEGMRRTGYSDFSLLSLSCSDYLALPAVGVELRNRLADQNVSLTLPSQRVDRFDQNIAHILGGTRKAGLTFAPEAGSQRLRDIVNKGLTDDDLLRGIRTAMESGYRKVKLYFMIGLPGETDEDVLGIVETCRMLQQRCRDLGRLELNLTISNFTPKPHTPFQWHSVSSAEFCRRQQLLRQALRSLRGIKTNFTDPRLSAVEDFVGRGDRRLSAVVEAAWRAGAGLDAWFESVDCTYEAWTAAIEAAGLAGPYRDLELGGWSRAQALSGDDLSTFCEQALPWDHIDAGLSKRWLAEDLQRALAATVVPDCSFDGCSSCGVCGPDLGHNVVVPPPPIPPQHPPSAPASERVHRLRFGFSKTGSLALLSHLDVLRMLERALRRSGLPVSFTGGFHPLPRLQLALALPLGVEAEGEWLDLEFTETIDAATARGRLQEQVPAGFTLLSAREVPVAGASLAMEVEAALWRIAFQPALASSADAGASWPDRAAWETAVADVLAAESLLWQDTDKKGRPRERECRPSLETLNLLAWEPQGVSLRLRATVDGAGRSLRPEQLRHWLAERLRVELSLGALCREALLLQSC